MSVVIKNNILLIGNGFDLRCGLPTKFSQFFKYKIRSTCKLPAIRKENFLDEITGDIFKSLISLAPEQVLHTTSESVILKWLKSNFFYFVFLIYQPKNDPLWFDIENKLKEYIVECNKCQCDVLSIIIDNAVQKEIDNDIPDWKGLSSYSSFFQKVNNVLKSELKTNLNNWSDWLLDSLHSFEYDFYCYVYGALQKQLLYSTMSENTLKAILTNLNKCKVSDLTKDKLYLINFNYTNPCNFSSEVHNKIVWDENNTTNVHGGGGSGNCIIGIDDTDIKIDESNSSFIKLHKFSKTFRRLNERFTKFNLPSPSKPINIIFFGLSLNRNDYSYYQSVFDKYDIYNNKNVNIYFCYAHKFENHNEVYKLLKHYGEKMSNKEQGKNLITLLSLEQRLNLVNVDELPFKEEM